MDNEQNSRQLSILSYCHKNVNQKLYHQPALPTHGHHLCFFQSKNSLLVQNGNWTSQSIKKLSTGGCARFQRWMRPPGTGSTRSNSPVYPSSHVLRHPAQIWACTAAFFTDPRVQRPAGRWPSGSWRQSLVAVEAAPRSLHHRTLMFAGLKIAASTHYAAMQRRLRLL